MPHVVIVGLLHALWIHYPPTICSLRKTTYRNSKFLFVALDVLYTQLTQNLCVPFCLYSLPRPYTLLTVDHFCPFVTPNEKQWNKNIIDILALLILHFHFCRLIHIVFFLFCLALLPPPTLLHANGRNKFDRVIAFRCFDSHQAKTRPCYFYDHNFDLSKRFPPLYTTMCEHVVGEGRNVALDVGLDKGE